MSRKAEIMAIALSPKDFKHYQAYTNDLVTSSTWIQDERNCKLFIQALEAFNHKPDASAR